ncbi:MULTISPECIES: hypothetical protein [unclassified Streptomyces]|uniref:hypothetical protein n=1 Tax=unclassified Streptomyces TaxID=2593676 RepID=UPI00203733A0|nr:MULTISPECIES: hypothetical protein [unclassified Streptomyces]
MTRSMSSGPSPAASRAWSTALAAISTARSFSSAGQWRLTIPVFSRIQASSMPSASICSKWALVTGAPGK